MDTRAAAHSYNARVRQGSGGLYGEVDRDGKVVVFVTGPHRTAAAALAVCLNYAHFAARRDGEFARYHETRARHMARPLEVRSHAGEHPAVVVDPSSICDAPACAEAACGGRFVCRLEGDHEGPHRDGVVQWSREVV
jgi:hypothetical protein